MSASIGLNDSAYRQGIQNVQSETKKTVSSLSGEYSKAAKAVVELTRRYNESVGKTGKASSETKNLKTMLAQAEAQLRATTTALKAANNGMEGFASSTDKASGKSLASAITQGTVMANVFSKLGSAALSAAEGFISSGIEYNAQIEKYTTGFTNMLGSAEAAQQVMSQIQEDAAKTPFDVESLTKANQYLISAGENASYARGTIMALGDAVSATGGGNDELNRMAQNLQQIANTGKATAVDIKQFAYAGIDVYGILADYTGKSTAEVQNMTISYDLLTQALQAASEEGGRYYNSMDTQSQTMNGRVSTLQDNVKQLAGLLTGDLSSGVGVVIGNLNDLIVKAQEAYKTDGWIGLAGAITGLTEPINTAKNAFKDFASKATTWLDQLSYKLNRFLGKAATADFDTYEEYADANNRQSNRNRLRQNALKGVGISSKSWSERQAELAAANGSGGSSIVTTGGSSGSSGGKKSGSSGSKSTTETVISSISSTATTTAQNALGTVTTSIQTLTEKVKDSAGSIKDRITETTTTTGKEMVNGVATTFKQVETKVNGTVTKTTKTYDDMSKTLLGTFTNVSETTFNGITTKVQQAVEKYADGSEHIKKTVTETGQRIGENGAETYEKIITYIDGIQDKVTETSNEIDKSVKGTQNRIDQQLSEASGQLDKGIFGLVKSAFSDAKNGDWGGLALDFVNLIWGEVSQEQRDVISKWLADALGAINEGYSGGGIGKALESIQKIFTDGITPGIDGATTEVKAFSEIIDGLAKSGGVGGALGSIVQSFSGMAGGITSALGTIVSFVAANPILALILGVGAVAGGIGLAAWMNKKNDTAVSHYQSPFDKTGVYDSLGTFSTRAALQYRVTGQQSIVDRQTSILERIEGMLDEHLPDIGKGQVVMDSGELVGVLSPRMATNVDARIGVTVTRKARGV